MPPTTVHRVDADRPEPALLERAAAILKGGGLVAFATETVYGLGAVATDASAVKRIYAAKGRPSTNPLIVHAHDTASARELTTGWSEAAEQLAGAFWPGPLTLVLHRAATIPDVVTAGRATVGIRVPASFVARELIRRVGRPLAAPSANRSNRVSPTRAEHVLAELGGRIEMILDSGPTEVGIESTVVDLTRQPFQILRPGPIGLAEISGCLRGLAEVAMARSEGQVEVSSAPPQRSPGMLPVHYAPATPAWRVEEAAQLATIDWPARAWVLSMGTWRLPPLPDRVRLIVLRDPVVAGRRLYEYFHRCDDSGFEQIVVVMPPRSPEWSAVRDRLLKATQPLRFKD